MLDIIFISYDEPNADKHFDILNSKFPYAKRIHGVEGIANAHLEASKIADTNHFYVVDADAIIVDSFDFSYKPSDYEKDFVHIWYSHIPALFYSYGYGGVKLFAKHHFKNFINSNIDFSTTLTKDVKINKQISCFNYFNSDPFTSFRGAYREVYKLLNTIDDVSKEQYIIDEAKERFNKWLNPVHGANYKKFITNGAFTAIEHYKSYKDGFIPKVNINDFKLLKVIFNIKNFEHGL